MTISNNLSNNNTRIYTREDVHLVVKYEFLFDRFRAIRQDLIIQRIRNEQVAMILERIMNFYILADYKYYLNLLF